MVSVDTRINYALKIRRAAEKKLEEGSEDYSKFDKNFAGLCAICSAALVEVLRREGYDAKLLVGWFRGRHSHCWVETNKEVLDVTATQFWGVNKPLIKIDKSGRLYRAWFQYGFEAKSLDEFHDWPEAQRPTDIKINRLLAVSGLN